MDEEYLDLHWTWVKDLHRSWSPLMTETIPRPCSWTSTHHGSCDHALRSPSLHPRQHRRPHEMRLAANARIIVQCFLERLPFVLEDHTVWIAPNKTVHSKGSIEGREGACGQAAAGVKGKASKPSRNRRPYPCRSIIEGIPPPVGQRDGLGLRISMGQLPLRP